MTNKVCSKLVTLYGFYRMLTTTWRVALTIAASISSGFPHSGHTETGYHCRVSVTFSDWSRVLPEWPFCPPDFLPEGLRRDCVCRMPIGFPEGGTLLFVLFFMTGFLPLPSSATWDANSAIRASLTFISLSRTERIRSIRASSLSFSSRVLTRALLIFACTSSRSASSVESSSSQRPSSRRICLRRRESFTRSASTLFPSPVLKFFFIPPQRSGK